MLRRIGTKGAGDVLPIPPDCNAGEGSVVRDFDPHQHIAAGDFIRAGGKRGDAVGGRRVNEENRGYRNNSLALCGHSSSLDRYYRTSADNGKNMLAKP